MKSLRIIGGLVCGFWILMTCVDCIQELEFLHVVFAHKSYAPISSEIGGGPLNFPKKLTYEYFNSAAMEIPNAGKLNMYNLGVYLRHTYDKFLGDSFTNETMRMRTTEHPLSMLSAQLVNAGLWPPSEDQKWNKEMNWQPIPTEYVSMERDSLLLGTRCPNFIFEMEDVLRTKQVQDTLLNHQPLFDYVSHYTGMKIDRPSDIALLYASLETNADFNLSLPHWANDIFPHGGMYNVTLLEYDLLSQTRLQKQLNGGTMLKEIVGNSLKFIHGFMSRSRRLMLYSGDERNIVGLLKSMDLWSPHIPSEAASLIFELHHDNETGTHALKVNYYTGAEGDVIPLKLPDCAEFCPLGDFIDIVFDLIPENDELLCNWKITGSYQPAVDRHFSGSRSSYHAAQSILIFTLFVFISYM